MTFDIDKLIDMAIGATNNSYVPYSNFRVGAAILLKNGEYVLGSNIENKSYSMTVCAERCALFNLISHGFNKDDVVAMAVVGNTEGPITPCGACREVMDELLYNDTKVVLANMKKDKLIVTVGELLPLSFKLEK